MFDWIMENSGTILVSAVLLTAVAAAALHLLRDRRKGSSSCGCGCAQCAMHEACHSGK